MVFYKTDICKNTYKNKISSKHIGVIDNFDCGPSKKSRKIRRGIIGE